MNKCRENIKNLIPKPITPVIKPPMYRSVFTESVKRVYNSNKDCHRTMGYAEVQLDPPTQFLKKNTRQVIRPFVEKYKCDKKSPRLPKQSLPCEEKPKKNIIAQNIIDARRRVPPLPKHRVQDSRNGHVIVLNEAGLEPTYVCKKNYGTTPKYIIKMYKEKETARQKEEDRVRAIKPLLRLLPQEEREGLLTGLKTNWAELHKEFLLLPVLTDTERKVKRKHMLDKELATLEKDIDMLERNPIIYVEDK
ncbi:Enkurin domain [Cinara cedri]|uniref:Enkurin domain n=1 Tax=Cinara cedri TaxID=506608 RepID=A0A5E4N6N8_9HEMI|nr:Enkurin domain [Cinara cedri]